jgi:hypothetical protein
MVFKAFEKLCSEKPDLCQEMADEGGILHHDMIKIALKHNIKFKQEFLEEIGFQDQ